MKMGFIGDLQCAELKIVGAIPADFVVANLEVPLTRAQQAQDGRICLKSDPREARLLELLQVNAVSLANNHIFDFGEEGARETMATLDALGIAHFGCGSAGNNYNNPLLVSTSLGPVALLAYADTLCRPLSQAGTLGIALYEPQRLTDDVQHARRLGAQRVVVYMHWGHEDCPVHAPEQLKMARQMKAQGVDLVIGMHGHTVQPFSGDGVYYGLGNFFMKEFDVPILEHGQDRGRIRKRHLPWNTRSLLPIVDLKTGLTQHYLTQLSDDQQSVRLGPVASFPIAPTTERWLPKTEPFVRRGFHWLRLAILFWRNPRIPTKQQIAYLLGRAK